MKMLLASINSQKAEIEINPEAHKQVILEAQSAACELVVFPEMSLTGYLDPTVYDDHVATGDSH